MAGTRLAEEREEEEEEERRVALPLAALAGTCKMSFPAQQMLNTLCYQDMADELKCGSCGRWKTGSNSAPIVSAQMRLIKNKVLYAKDFPLACRKMADLHYPTADISLYHKLHTFCIAEDREAAAGLMCETCKVTIRSNVDGRCQMLHTARWGKTNCRLRYRCDDCLMQYPLTIAHDEATWRRSHICFEQVCRSCREMMHPAALKTHCCPLKLFAKPQAYRRIACYDFETSADTETSNGEHDAVFVSMYFETETLGHFKLIRYVIRQRRHHRGGGQR